AACSQDVVVGVQDIDIWPVAGPTGEARIKGQAKQASVPEVVDIGGEVAEHRRRRVGQVVEYLDVPALLGDEDAPVSRKPDRRRVRQAGPDDAFLESDRHRGRDLRPAARCDAWLTRGRRAFLQEARLEARIALRLLG